MRRLSLPSEACKASECDQMRQLVGHLAPASFFFSICLTGICLPLSTRCFSFSWLRTTKTTKQRTTTTDALLMLMLSSCPFCLFYLLHICPTPNLSPSSITSPIPAHHSLCSYLSKSFTPPHVRTITSHNERGEFPDTTTTATTTTTTTSTPEFCPHQRTDSLHVQRSRPT